MYGGAAAAVLALTISCGETAGVADAGADLSPTADQALDGTVGLTLAPGGAGNGKLGQTLTSAEVRAGRVQHKDHLLSGIKVEGQVGDYKIYNNRAAFIIQDGRPGSGLGPNGGEVLDAQLLGLKAPAGRSLLGETLLGAITRGIKPRSVGVVHDGSDGKQALIRVIGDLAPVPLLETYIPVPGREVPAHVVLDYSLAPDSAALSIQLRFFNKQRVSNEIPLTLLVLTAGDGLQYFASGKGFDTSAVGRQDYLAMVGQQISYALVGLNGTRLTPVILRSGIWILSMGSVTMPPAGEARRQLKLVLAGGDAESVRVAARKELGLAALTTVSGKVTSSKGSPLAGARVHARSAAGGAKAYQTMARTDASGRYALTLAAGSYLLTAVEQGHAPTEVKTTVGQTAVTRDITMGGSAALSFTVTDGNGQALPAKLIVKRDKPQTYPASFGEPGYLGQAARILFPLDGKGTVKLAPGQYSVTASRGFEYEIETKKLTLAAGQTSSASFKLTRSVKTAGYMCGDFHVHAMWSYDASDLYELKVAALAAEGLEVPVASEHDHIGDFNPTIAKLGLQPWIQTIVGVEVTTGSWGHFNVYPVTAAPLKPNAGALPWYGKAPAKLFGDIRAAWPAGVLQVNHPRSTAFGYFLKVGYSPADGAVKDKAAWTTGFDAVEVFNASGWERNKDTTVKDWFSMLDRGLIHAATGNSDSHAVYTHEVGYPRNYVKLPTDTPSKLVPTDFMQAIKGLRVVISGGAFISAEIGGKGPGQLAQASAGKVTVAVKVQAPTWVKLDTLQLIRGGKTGGEVLKTIVLDSSTADPKNPVLRYDGKLELSVTADTWIVVVATGKGELTPVVHKRQPFGVTNPIFVDVNGNGKYDAPQAF